MSTKVSSSVDNYSWVESFFSPERIESYLHDSNYDYEFALGAYCTDLKALGEATLWINLLEVALRNAVTNQIQAAILSDQREWFAELQPILNKQSREALSVARRRIERNGAPVTGASMKAALPLGFWMGLFARQYEATLWTPAIRRAFPILKKQNRQFVQSKLFEIYQLRNHVAHQGLISVAEMHVGRNRIVEVLSWISPEGHAWALEALKP